MRGGAEFILDNLYVYGVNVLYLCTDNIRHLLFKLCLSYFTSAARRPSYKSLWARLEKPRPTEYVVVDTYVTRSLLHTIYS